MSLHDWPLLTSQQPDGYMFQEYPEILQDCLSYPVPCQHVFLHGVREFSRRCMGNSRRNAQIHPPLLSLHVLAIWLGLDGHPAVLVYFSQGPDSFLLGHQGTTMELRPIPDGNVLCLHLLLLVLHQWTPCMGHLL